MFFNAADMHCKCCSRDYITSHVTHRNPFNPGNGINTAGVTLRGLQKHDMCQAAFLLSRLKVQPPTLPCRHQNKHCHALKSKLHQCEFLLECECVFSMHRFLLLHSMPLNGGRCSEGRHTPLSPNMESNVHS